MNKKNILFTLIIICCVCFSACASSEKKAEAPDRFEKWRVLAEESKGNTPGPRESDLYPVHTRDNRDRDQEDRVFPETSDTEKQAADQQAEPRLPEMPVTMKMHEVPVPVLLRTLARIAGMNIMINDTVKGSASLNIRDLPWDKAFTSLLSTYGLTYQWADQDPPGVLRIITIEDLKREIELMEARQEFEKSKKAHAITMQTIQQEEKKLAPLMTRIIKIDYADLEPLRDNIEAYLLSENSNDLQGSAAAQAGENRPAGEGKLRGAILMDRHTNSLIINATADEINRLIPIIRRLDRPSEQVLIEAHIVEANSDTAKELGIQWGGLGLSTAGDNNTWIGGPIGSFDTSLLVNSDDATADAPAGSGITHLPQIGTGINFPSSENAGTSTWQGMTIGLMTQNVGDYLLYTQLTALQEDGKLNILSKPSITTMDHKKAIIESGKEVPFQSIEDGEIKIEFKKAVIKLEVTPHVINNKVVRLEILTHKDELDWSNTVSGNPTIITKNAETRVNLFDGQTTVIGGLNKEKTQESESGIPYLKDLPVLGHLFRSNSDAQDMEELLIFITPHILKQKELETSSDE